MEKAFAIAGHTKDDLYRRFGALIKAFNHGTPPHGGAAPGIDRMVMLLAGTPNIREVIAFPMNQKARDLMMDAPCAIENTNLKELGLSIVQAKKFDDNDN
jgi:aspartyl-tRNA synthetase